MKLTIKHKVLSGLAILLFILIITNPSIQAFKEHVGSNTYSGLYREKNFFVASVYRYHSREYVGVIGNFINKSEDVNSNTIKSDTTVKDPFAEFGGHIVKDTMIGKYKVSNYKKLDQPIHIIIDSSK